MSKQRGYVSLIEIMIGVAILGIVVVVMSGPARKWADNRDDTDPTRIEKIRELPNGCVVSVYHPRSGRDIYMTECGTTTTTTQEIQEGKSTRPHVAITHGK